MHQPACHAYGAQACYGICVEAMNQQQPVTHVAAITRASCMHNRSCGPHSDEVSCIVGLDVKLARVHVQSSLWIAFAQPHVACGLASHGLDALQAFATATGLLSASMLLGGFYITIKAMYLSFTRGLSWASFTRYLLSGLFQIELNGQYPGICTLNPSTGLPEGDQSCASYGDQLLSQIGLNNYSIGVAFAAQIGFLLLWIVLGYLALLRLKERR